jgi:hypothetical protein
MFNVPLTRRRFFFADPYFQSKWSDYDKVRSSLSQEPTDSWKRFEDDFRNATCMTSDLVESDLDYYGSGSGK